MRPYISYKRYSLSPVDNPYYIAKRRNTMQITEESTRFVFKDYTDNELSILRKLISADGNHFLYEDNDWVACPIGVENYIKRKFPDAKISTAQPWTAAKMKYIPKQLPPPKNKLQKDALKFLKEYKDRPQLGLICAPGQGKAQPITTKIPTPDGYKLMGDLVIGDTIFDMHGKPTIVTGTFDQGVLDVYEITLDDGRRTRCCSNHLWTVYDMDDNNVTKTIKLKHMIELTNSGSKYRFAIPKNGIVEFNPKKLPINPFIVGHAVLNLEHVDDYIFSKLPSLRQGLIPEEYLTTDVNARISLLRGICLDIDSDTITSPNSELIKQIANLCQGLCVPYTLTDDGITIIDPMDIHPYSYDLLYSEESSNTIIDIKHVGKDECRCIMVDNDEHLYLTNDFIVTHNTYMSINHALTVGEKTLIVCPTTAILTQWISTLTDLFDIPANRILHVSSSDKLNKMKMDYDWVLVLEQTLQTLVKKNELEQLLSECKFGMKIIDEIHMFLRNNIAIDCCSNIKRNVYLTGTFFRTQQEESNLFNAVYHGILRFEVVDQEDIEKYGQKKHIEIYSVIINSKLTNQEVRNIVVNAKIGRKSAKVVSIGRYMQVVCPDNGKVTEYMKQSLQVVKRMKDRVKYGRMLVLVPSIFATTQFRKLIADMYPKLKVGCINSTQSRSLNDRVKAEADIVISTSKSAGVGFDMSDLSVLIAVEQFRSPVMVEQISGRLRPRADGKSCFYVDIADKALGQYLLRWRNERLERLKVKAKSYEQFRVSSDN